MPANPEEREAFYQMIAEYARSEENPVIDFLFGFRTAMKLVEKNPVKYQTALVQTEQRLAEILDVEPYAFFQLPEVSNGN